LSNFLKKNGPATWLLLAAAYAVAGKFGLTLAFVHASATAVWLPTGIALAAALILGPRAWPGIFLGAFFVHEFTAGSWLTSLAIAAGNTLQALAGAYLVNRFAGGRAALGRGKGLTLFVLYAALVSTAISATAGVTSLCAAGFAPWSGYGHIWLTWWLGHALGALVVAPVLILWAEQPRVELQAEGALHRSLWNLSERRLQTIFDTEPACVKLVSPDGLLMEMNRAGLEMLGACDVSLLVGRPVVDLVHPDDRRRFVETHRAASEGTRGRLEFRIIGLDAGERWVDSRMVPFETTADGRETPSAVLSVTTDITDRKRLEEQLRQSQKMDALGRLAGGITHDFNNYLTALIGYTELALRQIGDDETVYPDLKNDLHEVLKIGRRAAGLTRQLLMFSRSPMLEPPLVDFDATLAPMETLLAQMLGVKVRFRMVMGSGRTRVRIDPSHLEQIVVNLAVNARDAMPEGGKLTIETSVIGGKEIPPTPGNPTPPAMGSYLLLTASDNGMGMEDHVKAHLFEPFFTTKTTGEGTGLGLATVYGIVKQSSGCISVTSEPGQGTTFKLYFPLAPAPSPIRMEQPVPEAEHDEHQTVLVVDDDQYVRAVARDVLREHGYRVLEAGSGEEADRLAATYTKAIHLLVADVMMPGITGPDLLARLRRTRPELPVLFMSGYQLLAITHHHMLDPDSVLLEKPFATSQLLEHVRAALEPQGQNLKRL
jgi:PAS domain S-box-containing protein